MIKIYYLICVDAINKAKIVSPAGWKFATFMYISAFFSILLISIFSILESLFDFSISYSKSLAKIKVEAIYLYFMPSLIINYFLLFYDKKYIKLLETYKPNDGKYFFRFLIFCVVIFLMSIIFKMIY